MNRNSRILVTGCSGLVGNSLKNNLTTNGYKNILTPKRKELDLMNRLKVQNFIKKNKPEYVFAAAAFVGGIEANMNAPFDFFFKNLEMQNNLLTSCNNSNVNNLAFFGSSCIYPKLSKQPINENELLSGFLEKTNEGYAIAKIAGLKFCEYLRKKYKRNYFTIMPTNLYGPNDNYNIKSSHVIPSIISKIYHAKKNNTKKIHLFGTGKAKREFLFVDDLAKASILAMKKNKKYSLINVGSGSEITIEKLAKLILKISNYNASLIWSDKVPDGTPRKILNSSRMSSFGWKPTVSLIDGLKYVYDMYENNIKIRS